VLHAILGFLFIYVVSIVSLTLLLIATRLDVITAFSAVVACINNTGPGLNLVGPASTYAVLNDFQTWVCTWAMLLGRLEIFTLLVLAELMAAWQDRSAFWRWRDPRVREGLVHRPVDPSHRIAIDRELPAPDVQQPNLRNTMARIQRDLDLSIILKRRIRDLDNQQHIGGHGMRLAVVPVLDQRNVRL
jgi:hypothetical protein